jgi:hypothetical protein
MSKNKALIPVIVILAVAVLAGGYWAWKRYEEQKVAQQFLSGIAALGGGNASDLQKLAKLANSLPSGETGSVASEGAAETPQDKFNSTEAVQSDSDLVKNAANEIGPIVKEVFGDAKLSSFLNNYFGDNTGMVLFTIPREAVSGDLNKLNSAFTSQGYTISMSGIESSGGSVIAIKNNTQYMVTFDIGGQEVTVVVLPEAAQ